jgi:hypothetical protein
MKEILGELIWVELWWIFVWEFESNPITELFIDTADELYLSAAIICYSE